MLHATCEHCTQHAASRSRTTLQETIKARTTCSGPSRLWCSARMGCLSSRRTTQRHRATLSRACWRSPPPEDPQGHRRCCATARAPCWGPLGAKQAYHRGICEHHRCHGSVRPLVPFGQRALQHRCWACCWVPCWRLLAAWCHHRWRRCSELAAAALRLECCGWRSPPRAGPPRRPLYHPLCRGSRCSWAGVPGDNARRSASRLGRAQAQGPRGSATEARPCPRPCWKVGKHPHPEERPAAKPGPP